MEKRLSRVSCTGIRAFGTSLFASCYLERQGDNFTVKPLLSGHLLISRNTLPIFTVNYCKFNSVQQSTLLSRRGHRLDNQMANYIVITLLNGHLLAYITVNKRPNFLHKDKRSMSSFSHNS